MWAVEPWPPAIGAEGGLDRRDWHFFGRAAGVRFSVRDAGADREGDPSVTLHHYVPRMMTASRQLLPPGVAPANRRGPLASPAARPTPRSPSPPSAPERPAVGCSGRHHKREARMREPEIVCSGTSAVPHSGGRAVGGDTNGARGGRCWAQCRRWDVRELTGQIDLTGSLPPRRAAQRRRTKPLSW